MLSACPTAPSSLLQAASGERAASQAKPYLPAASPSPALFLDRLFADADADAVAASYLMRSHCKQSPLWELQSLLTC